MAILNVKNRTHFDNLPVLDGQQDTGLDRAVQNQAIQATVGLSGTILDIPGPGQHWND